MIVGGVRGASYFHAMYIALALVFSGERANAAGFNCWSGGLQLDEQAVCSDDKLSSSDEYLNKLYKYVVSTDPSAAATVRSDQRRFLSQRRTCGKDIGCIRSLYQARIAELEKVSGDEDFEIEEAAQPANYVSQALQLLGLALQCASKPIQEASNIQLKYERRFTGDASTLQITSLIYYFEGFKFRDRPGDSDTPIAGINSEARSVTRTVSTSALEAIGKVKIWNYGQTLEIECNGSVQCFDVATTSQEVSCTTWRGAGCTMGNPAPQKS
jgi:uncharacterized protein